MATEAENLVPGCSPIRLQNTCAWLFISNDCTRVGTFRKVNEAVVRQKAVSRPVCTQSHYWLLPTDLIYEELLSVLWTPGGYLCFITLLLCCASEAMLRSCLLTPREIPQTSKKCSWDKKVCTDTNQNHSDAPQHSTPFYCHFTVTSSSPPLFLEITILLSIFI